MRNQVRRAARTGKHGKAPRFRQITAAQFRELRHYCVLSVPEVAKLLHVTERTVHNWESGATRPPYAAFKLLRILRGYELPGHAWRGWQLFRDVLITPEGHHLRASDAACWSLLAAQARQFRILLAETHHLRTAVAQSASAGLVLSSTSHAGSQDQGQSDAILASGYRQTPQNSRTSLLTIATAGPIDAPRNADRIEPAGPTPVPVGTGVGLLAAGPVFTVSAATTSAAVVAAPEHLPTTASSETLEPRSDSLPLAPNTAFAVGTSFNKYLKGQAWRHSGVTLAQPSDGTVCASHGLRGVNA